jgi:teichoic acid transport system permease protein
MSLAEYAAGAKLRRVGARPPLLPYLVDVWRHRPFIYRLARFRIEAENGRSRLGMGWVILNPIIDAIVYGSVFGVLLGRDAIPGYYYIPFLVIGVFFFDYFSSCFTAGSKSITRNTNLVQSLSFPRMSLPLALVTQRFLEFVPMVVITIGLVLAWGIPPQVHWLLLLPLVGLFTIFNAGLAMITARLTVHFRDLEQLLPYASRILFYTSGVFFSIEKRFGTHPVVMRIADFQPIHEFLSITRGILLPGTEHVFPHEYWLYASVWSIVTFIIGSVFFWAAEERYGRVD